MDITGSTNMCRLADNTMTKAGGVRCGDVLADGLAVEPQCPGHLCLGSTRVPVRQDLGHVDHLEAPSGHPAPLVRRTREHPTSDCPVPGPSGLAENGSAGF